MTEVDSSQQAIAACVQQLNQSIGDLARCYGVAAVVAALTEVMGCSFCIADSLERGTSMRALVERMSAQRDRS
jgi:hypothetical protein